MKAYKQGQNYKLPAQIVAEPYHPKFVQPKLTQNGTLGGDTFACSGTNIDNLQAWILFDGDKTMSHYVRSQQASGDIIFYDPTGLNITNLNIMGYTADSNWWVQDCTLYGSNDGSTWTSLSTYSPAFQSVSWNISHNGYYKYFKIHWNRNKTGLLWIEIDITATLVTTASKNRVKYYAIK